MNIMLNSKILDIFSLSLGTEQVCSLSSFIFNIVLSILASAVKQKINKSYKKRHKTVNFKQHE